MSAFTNMLKGITGQLEIGRMFLAGGGTLAITSPIGFQVWDMATNGAHFDVTAWCLAYPSGLATLGGVGVYAIGKKDKSVAQAKEIDPTINGDTK